MAILRMQISILALVITLLHCAGCGSTYAVPAISSSALIGTGIIDNFQTRALAYDENFVSSVFEMGDVGYRMALSNIHDALKSKRIVRDTHEQRVLYLWIEALSTFYWPALYNRYTFREAYRLQIEQCFLEVLESELPAIHETMLLFIFLMPKAATEPMLRRAAELCNSTDHVVVELATHFCTTYFFCPEETPGEDLAKLSRLPSADINCYVTYWRYPPRGYAPPTRDALRAKSAKFIAESKVGKE